MPRLSSFVRTGGGNGRREGPSRDPPARAGRGPRRGGPPGGRWRGQGRPRRALRPRPGPEDGPGVGVEVGRWDGRPEPRPRRRPDKRGLGQLRQDVLDILTRIAPSFRSAFDPAQPSVRIGPGTAATSRPKSAAKRAVMSEPLFSAASTTRTSRRARRGSGSGSESSRGAAAPPGRTPTSRSRRHDLRQKRGMLGRIADVEAAAEDRDRHPPRLERRAVRRGVDPAREAGYDDDAGPRQPPGEVPGRGKAGAGGAPAPTTATAGCR